MTALVAVVGVTVAHIAGNGPSCSVAPPLPSLNGQLRALGGFDQPFDAGDTPVLQRVAQQAAGASEPTLIGATTDRPVRVRSASSGRPDAVVVPLRATAGRTGAPTLAGLVDFLLDCSGRAYYSAVTLSTEASDTFPAVDAAAAQARLGVADPTLIYTETPFHPSWRNPSSGATISAG